MRGLWSQKGARRKFPKRGEAERVSVVCPRKIAVKDKKLPNSPLSRDPRKGVGRVRQWRCSKGGLLPQKETLISLF